MNKFLITIFILSSVFTFAASAATPNNPCEAREGFCLNLAQVPGLEFLDLPRDAKIGDILAAIYKFALGLIAISALIMFVFGGVMYMTAGDSQDRAKTARGYLSNSVLGLIIALLSWLALFTVNPDLVQRLEVSTIDIKKPVLVGGQSAQDVTKTDTLVEGEKTCKTAGGTPAFLIDSSPLPGTPICIGKDAMAKQKVNPGEKLACEAKGGQTFTTTIAIFCTVPFK